MERPKDRPNTTAIIKRGRLNHILSSTTMRIAGYSGLAIGIINIADGDIKKGIAGSAGGLTLNTIEIIRSYREGKN